jgi:hypothetical protein
MVARRPCKTEVGFVAGILMLILVLIFPYAQMTVQGWAASGLPATPEDLAAARKRFLEDFHQKAVASGWECEAESGGGVESYLLDGSRKYYLTPLTLTVKIPFPKTYFLATCDLNDGLCNISVLENGCPPPAWSAMFSLAGQAPIDRGISTVGTKPSDRETFYREKIAELVLMVQTSAGPLMPTWKARNSEHDEPTSSLSSGQ